MPLTLKDDLPFTTVTLTYAGAELDISDVLIDTGSASTIFKADVVAVLGITPELNDVIHTIRGVGGAEVVFSRQVDRLWVEGASVEGFEIEVGRMNYGFAMNGILGMDFLLEAGAIINLRDLRLLFENETV